MKKQILICLVNLTLPFSLHAQALDKEMTPSVTIFAANTPQDFVPPEKFPDLPGVYQGPDQDEINKENEELINALMKPYYDYNTWLKQQTSAYLKTKDQQVLKTIANSILAWANAHSITLSKPWRYHFQKVVSDYFSSVLKIKADLMDDLGDHWSIVEAWIDEIIDRQIEDKKIDILTLHYTGNVGLQKAYNILILATITSGDKRIRALNDIKIFYNRCVSKGITSEGYYLGDISRASRALMYTYSSLYYLSKIYYLLKDHFQVDSSNLNKCITFYNEDIKNDGALYAKLAKKAQIQIKGPLSLVD